jgi:hypothetical protein
MSVPKNFRKNINIKPSKIGPERREEILHGIQDKGTYLPRGVNEEDMDEEFIDFIKNKLKMNFDGATVPVIFLTIQKWTEYTKTWEFTDEYKDIQLPFISIVRRPDIQIGQNQAGLWNIAGDRTYTYLKVPTWDGVRKGVDLYKIPQPTSVDITYEIRLFTKRMKDLNKFNSKVHTTFKSRQAYINVKGHPMPIVLESISDESNIEDFEQRRFYVQLFEMRLMGYLLDEDDFEVIPTLNRTFISMEIDENKGFNTVIFEPNRQGNVINYMFVFKPRSAIRFTFTAQYNLIFNQLINIQNLTDINIQVNGVTILNGLTLNNPITLNSGDIVLITISKNSLVSGQFQLIGNTI